MKARSKMKWLLSGQHFLKSMGPSRMGNSQAKKQKWAKIELLRDFVPVIVICKFDEDSIKMKFLLSIVICKFDEDLIKIKSLLSGQHFPHYMSMRPFDCHGNQSSDQICH